MRPNDVDMRVERQEFGVRRCHQSLLLRKIRVFQESDASGIGVIGE